MAGRDRNYRWLAPYLAESSGRVVLDVGGGTGEVARILPPTASYIWLDNDLQKLEGLRQKKRDARALLGDASRIGLGAKSVDFAVCIAMAHHLTDAQLGDALREFARICRVKLIFLDPVRDETSWVSQLMWRYDRGSYPRTVDALRSQVSRYFVIETEAENSVYHHYWLCKAVPKAL
jgi:ubiquinone/menaquinone biosynthesis C-methylase UbiE